MRKFKKENENGVNKLIKENKNLREIINKLRDANKTQIENSKSAQEKDVFFVVSTVEIKINKNIF